jgi:hypothetical protein
MAINNFHLAYSPRPIRRLGNAIYALYAVAAFDLLRTVLGVVLLTAAALKWHALALRPQILGNTLSAASFGLAVVTVELLLGAWLISGAYQTRAHSFAIFWFAALCGLSLVKAAAGDETCDCLGTFQVAPFAMVFFDLAAVGLLCRFIPRAIEAGTARLRRSRGTLWIWATLLAITPSGAYAFTTHNVAILGETSVDPQGGKRVLLVPEHWVGKRFPLLEYIEIQEDLGAGDWVVVLYRANCEKCRLAIPRYRELAHNFVRAKDSRRVALIALAAEASMPVAAEPRDAACELGRVSNSAGWIVATPMEIWLHAGIVSKIGP